jgi:hypothetical protein
MFESVRDVLAEIVAGYAQTRVAAAYAEDFLRTCRIGGQVPPDLGGLLVLYRSCYETDRWFREGAELFLGIHPEMSVPLDKFFQRIQATTEPSFFGMHPKRIKLSRLVLSQSL